MLACATAAALAADRNGSADCSFVSPCDALSENESRASRICRPACKRVADAPAVNGVHAAAIPKPVATRPVRVMESATASHTRTTTMNSATSFWAARAAASATSCTSAATELMRCT